ncbi:tetratricopeptide repeat protein [Spirochaeta cellobiosiphila]|uniref:tetratricopeptide repeat protein n=1 Tax=Spirochaeta cellobiosiphila TaxID=504483 RepID=UPI0004921B13|nr:hypothetical protein [Spirochaeta cellobiosiphila]
MKYKFILVTLILLPFILYSQDNKVSAPFISRLQIHLDRGSAIITWKDSRDLIEGKYRVLRAGQPINNNNYPSAQVMGDVELGKEKFIDDTIQVAGTYYYAVLGVTTDEEIINTFIPYRNTTVLPFEVTEADLMRAALSNITMSASTQNDRIILKVKNVPDGVNILYFRSSTIIATKEDLQKAYQIQPNKLGSQQYADVPIPGIQYYYAVIDDNSFQTDQYELELGRNSTRTPVKLGIKEQKISTNNQEMRSLPLPQINLYESIDSDTKLNDSRWSLPEWKDLSEESKANVRRYMALYDGLEEDRLELKHLKKYGHNVYEDNVNLMTIINGPISNGDFTQSKDLLKAYLTLNLNDMEKASGHYYLGISYLFLGDSKNALLNFLITKDYFKEESTYYIEYIMNNWITDSPFNDE